MLPMGTCPPPGRGSPDVMATDEEGTAAGALICNEALTTWSGKEETAAEGVEEEEGAGLCTSAATWGCGSRTGEEVGTSEVAGSRGTSLRGGAATHAKPLAPG